MLGSSHRQGSRVDAMVPGLGYFWKSPQGGSRGRNRIYLTGKVWAKDTHFGTSFNSGTLCSSNSYGPGAFLYSRVFGVLSRSVVHLKA